MVYAAGGVAGGFRDAAVNILQGAATAELKAIAQAAAHRLERGIWTRFLSHAIPPSHYRMRVTHQTALFVVSWLGHEAIMLTVTRSGVIYRAASTRSSSLSYCHHVWGKLRSTACQDSSLQTMVCASLRHNRVVLSEAAKPLMSQLLQADSPSECVIGDKSSTRPSM